jgi:hypothetical protein
MAKEFKRPGSIGAVTTAHRLMGSPTASNPMHPIDRASEAAQAHLAALQGAQTAANARRFNSGVGNSPYTR